MKTGVGVGVIVLKDNKILLGLRNEDKEKASSDLEGQGTWTMPGGKFDFDENLLEAGIRETKEETDLDIKKIEVFCVQDDYAPNVHYVTVGLIATEYEGEVKTMEPDEIIKWEWFDFKNLPKNIYEPSRKCIEKYLNGKIY